MCNEYGPGGHIAPSSRKRSVSSLEKFQGVSAFNIQMRWFSIPTNPIVPLMTNKTLVTSMPLFNASRPSVASKPGVITTSNGHPKHTGPTPRRNSGNSPRNRSLCTHLYCLISVLSCDFATDIS